MKLKYIDINGHGILVDESAEIKENNWYYSKAIDNIYQASLLPLSCTDAIKIIFAEKELNLDVPKFNWKEWEVEQLAEKHADNFNVSKMNIEWQAAYKSFIEGYNHNKAKIYTEEDLRNAYRYGTTVNQGTKNHFNQFIQSLQKLPKYIKMQSENVQKSIDSLYNIKTVNTIYFKDKEETTKTTINKLCGK